MFIIETLQHVSIPITDTARSREFYAGMLKLPEIERPPFNFEGAWFQVGDGQIHLIGKKQEPKCHTFSSYLPYREASGFTRCTFCHPGKELWRVAELPAR
jgi:catechol 2,3-dioxygenase-like lactoylglutathione lyase family enzyme